MSWAVLIDLLLKFLPQLAELLRPLFVKAVPLNDRIGMDTPVAIAHAFDRARDQTYVWQFRARARIALGRRLALNHAHEFAAALRGEPVAPALTASERAEVARA